MLKRPPKTTRPLITSSIALRGLATGITLLSAGGMTAFAATHTQNTAAPLQPAASAATAVAAATPAPTATQRITSLSSRVSTTTSTAVTKTKRS